jgi:hypothetical protein
LEAADGAGKRQHMIAGRLPPLHLREVARACKGAHVHIIKVMRARHAEKAAAGRDQCSRHGIKECDSAHQAKLKSRLREEAHAAGSGVPQGHHAVARGGSEDPSVSGLKVHGPME